ncbi:MAG TPA: UvrD-helicase domain-containing protein, partial [Terriglobales bacterium]|nr:UvrD-helicase domain-containing protein [Terriglobales bacterium]
MSSLDPLALPLRGTTLIEASAGTGKTHTITTLYLRLLLEAQLTPAQILVVTYTNAATAELRGRVRSRVRQAMTALAGGAVEPSLEQLVRARRAHGDLDGDVQRLGDALNSFDEAAIFTIHGFCQRVLQENAFESGVAFDNELLTDISPMVEEVVCDFWVSRLSSAAPLHVAGLRHAGLTLAKLQNLSFRLLSHPSITLLPQPQSSPIDVEPLSSRWGGAFAEVAAIWRRDRDEILHLLVTAASLNRNRYQPDSIRRNWAPAMDAAIARGQPLLGWACSQLRRFSIDGLKDGTKANLAPPEHPFFKACQALCRVEAEVEAALNDWRLRLLHDFADTVRRELRRRKTDRRVQSFDDLLQELAQALNGDGAETLARSIRERYPAALIDEFQDTDPVQYDIFRRVYHGGGQILFLIGDPKQAIYGFRGADIYTYVRAKRDAGDRPETLETNRRSDPSLLRALNTLFGSAREQFAIAEIPYHAVTPPGGAKDRLAPAAPALEILVPSAADLKAAGATNVGACREQVAAATAAEIVRLLQSAATLDGRPIAPADIAVLTRTNKQATLMQDALRQLNVHSVLQTEESVFESRDALDVQRILLAIADPADGRAIRAALITAPFGLRGEDLIELEQHEQEWDAWVNQFQSWLERWNEQGFIAAFRALLDEREVAARLLLRPDGERRLTNLLHLMELLHGAATRERLKPLALARWLAVMRSDEIAQAAFAGEAVQIRLESDAAAVKLVTVHKAKGLEYPIVYCPFLWDGMLLHPSDKELPRFHDRTHGDRLILCLDGAKTPGYDEGRARREGLAENLRLLYVALTRARHRVSVVWGLFARNKIEETALGYLLHQPVEVDGDVVQATWNRLKAVKELDVRTDLEALVARAPEVIRTAALSLEPIAPYQPSTAAGARLSPRQP